MIRPQRWIAVLLMSLLAFQVGYQRDYLRDSWASAFGSADKEQPSPDSASPNETTSAQAPSPSVPANLGQASNTAAQANPIPVVQPNVPPTPPVSPFAGRASAPNPQQDSLTRSLDVITPGSDTNTGPNNASNPYFDKLSEQLQQLKEQSQVTEHPNPNSQAASLPPDEEDEEDLDLEEDDEFVDEEDEDTELTDDELVEDDDEELVDEDTEDLADAEQDSADAEIAP